MIDAVARAGFGGIAPWRREIEGHDVAVIGRRIRDAGLAVTGYCRSTYIPANDRVSLAANIADNKRALDDAASLGADSFVMVVGGLPAGSKDIAGARAQVAEAVAELLDHGRAVGVRIALEPLHPVYAADRSCLSLLSEVLDLCDRLDPVPAVRPALGVCLDVYHTWWDPNLRRDIARAGADRRITRLPRLRLAGADPRYAERSWHDGRRRHRHPRNPRSGGGSRLRRPCRSGDFLGARLVEAADRGDAGGVPGAAGSELLIGCASPADIDFGGTT